jgi:hypothetical protein
MNVNIHQVQCNGLCIQIFLGILFTCLDFGTNLVRYTTYDLGSVEYKNYSLVVNSVVGSQQSQDTNIQMKIFSTREHKRGYHVLFLDVMFGKTGNVM